ncbi:MAG: hypothetical protein U0793_00690 [Gemmataceae bacterium]
MSAFLSRLVHALKNALARLWRRPVPVRVVNVVPRGRRRGGM